MLSVAQIRDFEKYELYREVLTRLLMEEFGDSNLPPKNSYRILKELLRKTESGKKNRNSLRWYVDKYRKDDDGFLNFAENVANADGIAITVFPESGGGGHEMFVSRIEENPSDSHDVKSFVLEVINSYGEDPSEFRRGVCRA